MISFISFRSGFRKLSKFLEMQLELPINCVKRTYYNNQNLKKIFEKSLEAVNTKNLIRKNVRIENEKLIIRNQKYDLKNHNIYMVGFGKAVFNMATELEAILKDQLVKAIVSVPTGTDTSTYTHKMAGKSKITFIEGAKDNLPDLKSVFAAQEIFNFVGTLKKNDLLIVLVSGGGSALLPLPIPPINLTEKSDLIKKLSKNGANIFELNTVRKRISLIKGGGLARKAFPAYVITLILSDVIGDPLDVIASGPTLPNKDDPGAALEVIRKYGLMSEVSKDIQKVLSKPMEKCEIPLNPLGEYFHVENYIIGNNKLMVQTAKEEAERRGFSTMVLSTSIAEDANTLGTVYAELASTIGEVMLGLTSKAYLKLKFQQDSCLNLQNTIPDLLGIDFDNPAGVCIIGAGEPTVHVLGKGLGGRNQHLALQFSISIHNLVEKSPGLEGLTFSFLSCGTDGLDGPTDAAGAFGSSTIVPLSIKHDLDPQRYLRNSDSYNFYKEFLKGDFLIKTGHTGTNVMDLHCIIINKMFPRDQYIRDKIGHSKC